MAEKPKTPEQAAHEAECRKISEAHAGTKHSVEPGKKKGTFQVVTGPLTRKQLDAHLAVIKAAK